MNVWPPEARGPGSPIPPLPEIAHRTVRSIRVQVWLVAGLLVFVLGTSLAWNLWTAEKHSEELVWRAARSIADTIVAMRAWTAEQGGVYVPASSRVLPNPYLRVPDRDVIDDRGRRLTKVNPAYLTRLVAEELPGRTGIQIRLVSDRPLRPDNRPRGWETEALEFLTGRREALEWGQEGRRKDGRLEFRYVRALAAQGACLSCHGVQGYREGDLRGALSLSLDYTPFFESARAREVGLLLWHGLIAGVCLLGVGWFGRKLVRKAQAVEDAVARLRVLEGLLPICSVCKKIRLEGREESDQAAWVPVEAYVTERSHAEFSHGLCPQCLGRLYPEFSRPTDRRAGAV